MGLILLPLSPLLMTILFYSWKHFSIFLKDPVSDSLFFSPADHLDDFLFHILSGPFSISGPVLSQNQLSAPLSNSIKLSFTTGIFPTNLQTSKVIPIYKKGSKLEVNFITINLSPSSPTLIKSLKSSYTSVHMGFSKIKKQFLCINLDTEKITLLHKLCLTTLKKLWTLLIKETLHVEIDLQEAFDTVDHEILLKKLFHYDIRGTVLSLFRSYLTGRQQFASVSGARSVNKLISMRFHKAQNF